MLKIKGEKKATLLKTLQKPGQYIMLSESQVDCYIEELSNHGPSERCTNHPSYSRSLKGFMFHFSRRSIQFLSSSLTPRRVRLNENLPDHSTYFPHGIRSSKNVDRDTSFQ
ncbi:hypothetical protein Tco_0337624 [Tanacetum coccineum]